MSYSKSKTTWLGCTHVQTTMGHTYTEERSYSVLVLTKTLLGEVNPKWKSLIASGSQAATPLTASEGFCRFMPGKAQSIVDRGSASNSYGAPYYRDMHRTVEGVILRPLGQLAVAGNVSSKATAQALSRLYSALREQRSSMQAGVTAGELPQTIKGILDLTNSLARMSKKHLEQQAKTAARYLGPMSIDYRGMPVPDPWRVKRIRREPKRWEKLQQELRDGWLSFSLGFRPLVKDVKDLAQTVARWRFDYSHIRIKGYGEDRTVYPQSVSAGVINTINYQVVQTDWLHSEVIMRAGLFPDYDSPAFGSAHRLYTLLGAYDLENWVPTVWNLLPWSFVVDYVTNVADVVGAMVTDKSRVRWVLTTNRTTSWRTLYGNVPYQRQLVATIDGQPCYRTQSGNLGGYELSTRRIVRSPGVALVLPELTFNLPSTQGLAIPNLLALFTGQKPKRNYYFG